MKLHPLSELFPPMSTEEFADLKASIKENGQREPVLTLNGEVLDGRHRARACEELGIEVKIQELEKGVDPEKAVKIANLHRRHLTPGQRAMLAVSLTGLARGRPSKLEGTAREHFTRAEAAREARVNVGTLDKAGVVARRDPEVAAKVERAEMTLEDAYRLVAETGGAQSRPKGDPIRQAAAIRISPEARLLRVDEYLKVLVKELESLAEAGRVGGGRLPPECARILPAMRRIAGAYAEIRTMSAI